MNDWQNPTEPEQPQASEEAIAMPAQEELSADMAAGARERGFFDEAFAGDAAAFEAEASSEREAVGAHALPPETEALPEAFAFSDEADFSREPLSDSPFFSSAPPLDPQPQPYGLPEDAKQLPRLFPEPDEADEPQEEPVHAPAAPARARPRKRRSKLLRVLLFLGKWLLAIVLVIAVAAAGLIGYLSVTEYTPAHAENAQHGAINIARLAPPQQTLRILSFNTGYGGLGEAADFFMDGGTSVNPDSEQTVRRNMDGITEILLASDADFLFLQEVDTDSARSFEINQWLTYEKELRAYESRFALNYSCDYVPYPLTERIGKVHSGLATYSRYEIVSSTRYSLPCPFSWPTRVANLKRCMLVTRISLENREQELVLVNVHMEAYDDGEGRAEQTEQLLAFLEQEYAKGNYVIAGGDFNQSFPQAEQNYPLKSTSEWKPGELERLPAGWQYAYDTRTPTCRLLNQPYQPSDRATQYYVIDGFIVSPNITVSSVRTLAEDFIYSDHNPVELEVTLE